MKSRFKQLQNMLVSDFSSEGFIYKRDFHGKEKGLVCEIDTLLLSKDELGAEELEILSEGTPVFEQEKKVFYEPFFKRERMIILGAGHVAVPLSMLAKMTGFYVIVCDDRPDFADSRRFEYADEVICTSFEKAIEKVKPGAQDYVVIITRGHAYDEKCVEMLAGYEEPIYTGLIGSKRRVAMVLDGIKKRGYDASRLDRIHTPIGLDIGAKTIEEIDIAIMAEIIQVRRKESIGKTVVDRGDHDMQSIMALADIKHPCAIATILWDRGSAPRSAGAVMAIFADGTFIGSIGGGCVENAIIHQAKSLIGTGRFEIMHASLDGSSAMAEGMVCGGEIIVLVEDYEI